MEIAGKEIDLAFLTDPPIELYELLEEAGLLDEQAQIQVRGMKASIRFMSIVLGMANSEVTLDDVRKLPQSRFMGVITEISTSMQQAADEVTNVPPTEDTSST